MEHCYNLNINNLNRFTYLFYYYHFCKIILKKRFFLFFLNLRITIKQSIITKNNRRLTFVTLAYIKNRWCNVLIKAEKTFLTTQYYYLITLFGCQVYLFHCSYSFIIFSLLLSTRYSNLVLNKWERQTK